MINKKLLASTALAGLLAASNAFSQATNFVGPSLALTGSYVGGSSKFKTGDFLNDVVFQGTGIDAKLGEQTNIIPGLDLNYGFAAGNNFVIGVGATYDFSKTKTGGFNSDFTINSEDAAFTLDTTLKNHYSLYVQPTYVINKDSAMFAKVGRHYAKSTTTADGNFVSFMGDETSFSKNVQGWGYGLGLKSFLTNNLFVQAEAGVVSYDKVDLPFMDGADDLDAGNTHSSIKQKTTSATISVGYKF
jgi:opacity protein-like surface antigen